MASVNANINVGEIIPIPLEEYKELLLIKGRYEELKSKYNKDLCKKCTPTDPWGKKTLENPDGEYKITVEIGNNDFSSLCNTCNNIVKEAGMTDKDIDYIQRNIKKNIEKTINDIERRLS